MNAEPGPTVFFRAVLHPNRSLSPRGFRLLMLAAGGLCLALGMAFFLMGAWPIVGFLGLDVLLLYGAFKLSYRSGRLYETVELTDSALTVERVEPKGRARRWSFQPAWLRVRMDDPPRHNSQVTITSHGQSVTVGSFLAPEERLDFAKALNGALDRARRPGTLAGA